MNTCRTCADTGCSEYGEPHIGCDEWTSRDEGPLTERPDALASLEAKVESLAAQFETFQRAAADFIRTLGSEQ